LVWVLTKQPTAKLKQVPSEGHALFIYNRLAEKVQAKPGKPQPEFLRMHKTEFNGAIIPREACL
jgi:hypothetical protein